MNRRLRVLFVCASNRLRSVTAERIYRNDPRLEVRAAGVRTEAKRRISERDLDWADVIFVMERGQKAWIEERFRDRPLPPLEVLDIPDEFEVMDPELVSLLRQAVDPELDRWLKEDQSAP